MVVLLPQGQGRGSEIARWQQFWPSAAGGRVAGGTSGLLGEENKAQLLESYFWVGSAFQRAGPFGMEGSAFQRARSLGVVGERKWGVGLEKEGAQFVVLGLCLPHGQLDV